MPDSTILLGDDVAIWSINVELDSEARQIQNVLAGIYFDRLGEWNSLECNFHTRRRLSHPPKTIARDNHPFWHGTWIPVPIFKRSEDGEANLYL